MKVKDHSVSGETFELLPQNASGLLKTEPQPSAEIIGRYYQSQDYISHTDSQRTLFEKVYHQVRNFTLQSKLRLLQKYHPQVGAILDIGAGTGDFLQKAKAAGWKVSGFEPDDSARKIAESKGVTFVGETTELHTRSQDVITMWHVLEHVPDLDGQIRELKRLLKPDGLLVVAVPNHKSADAKHYGPDWAAYDVPRHLWHFSKESIGELFSQHDMQLITYKPMWFDSFYVSLLSEKIRHGRLNPIRAGYNGLISNLKGLKSGEYSSHIYLLRHKG